MSPNDPEDPVVEFLLDEPADDVGPDALIAHGVSLLREAPASPDEAAWQRDAATRLGLHFREALRGGYTSVELPRPERKSRP